MLLCKILYLWENLLGLEKKGITDGRWDIRHTTVLQAIGNRAHKAIGIKIDAELYPFILINDCVTSSDNRWQRGVNKCMVRKLDARPRE